MVEAATHNYQKFAQQRTKKENTKMSLISAWPRVDKAALLNVKRTAFADRSRKSITEDPLQNILIQPIDGIWAHNDINSINKNSLVPEKKEIESDLWEHARLQTEFDATIGREYDAKDMLTRSYNPVTDRFHLEKLKRRGDSAEAYKREILRNIETNLRERLQVGENIIQYRIEGNELYSDDFPDKPFSQVLLTGAEYRLSHGSEEIAREGVLGEIGGWEKIQQKFTNPNTPVGTKMTSFSPPGIVHDSAYDRQILDEFELVMGKEGNKYIQLTRRIVDFDQMDYDNFALSLDSHYFDGYDGRPWDAWLLSHPVEGSLADVQVKGMLSETFDKIFQSPLLQGMIHEYIEAVDAEPIDWQRVALHINAIYNQIDSEENHVVSGKAIEVPLYVSKDTIYAAVNRLGWQAPQEKGGAGCPTSKGYTLFNDMPSGSMINSVSFFAFALEKTGRIKSKGNGTGETEKRATGDMKCVTCPFCLQTVDAIVEEPNIYCPRSECDASKERKNGSGSSVKPK